jgi:hypothetical protein
MKTAQEMLKAVSKGYVDRTEKDAKRMPIRALVLYAESI